MGMSIWEYAEKHPASEMSEIDLRIIDLEAQLWEDDRNDPAWVRRQNREHNAPIFAEIQRLRRLREQST